SFRHGLPAEDGSNSGLVFRDHGARPASPTTLPVYRHFEADFAPCRRSAATRPETKSGRQRRAGVFGTARRNHRPSPDIALKGYAVPQPERTRPMQFLLMLYADEKAGAEIPAEDMAGAMDAMYAYQEALTKAGAYIATAALEPTSAARTLRIEGGEITQRDGSFVNEGG